MNQNYIPQRGVDFDDFIGSIYLRNRMGLESPQFTPVFCPANANHDDDFIGIRISGYATKEDGKLVQEIAYPAKNFTKDDLDKLFNKVETEDGVKYTVKSSASALDEVYIRVCYGKDGKKDNLKWVAAVSGGEVFHLSGDRRTYQPKDGEAEL